MTIPRPGPKTIMAVLAILIYSCAVYILLT